MVIIIKVFFIYNLLILLLLIIILVNFLLNLKYFSYNILNNSLFLNLIQISLLLIIKTIYISRFEGNMVDLLLHPVSIGLIFFMGIFLSLGRGKTSTIIWKGRNYYINSDNIKI